MGQSSSGLAFLLREIAETDNKRKIIRGIGVNYRHDIDGLRAVAVILVVFFHLELQNVPGGFIGVDAFFVISGYLITGILCREIEDDSFTFRGFYLRRLRRLGPALLSTILLTLVAGWFVFPPEMYSQTAQSTIAVIFSLGNVFFWQGTGYFESEAIFQPLLHTWSLGVEEQFYFVWPALLWLCVGRFSRIGLLIGIFAISLVSLISSEMLLTNATEAAFYLTPFRIFEFGVGAILAVSNLQARNIVIANALSLGGLFTLFGIGYIYTDNTPFPGLNALLPALATGAMIYAGPEPIMNRVMALAPMRYIGRISYSVYLLHWPIIVLYTFLERRPATSVEILALTCLSLLAGALQYHLVEAPTRRKTQGRFWMSVRWLGFGTGLTALTLLGASLMISAKSGFPSRLSPEILALFEELDDMSEERKVAGREGRCNGSQAFPIDYEKAFDGCLPDADTGLIVVLGDSHAKDVYVGLGSVFPNAPLVQMTANGCALNKIVGPRTFCSSFFIFWQDWLTENSDRIAAVVYSQNGEGLKRHAMGGIRQIPDMEEVANLVANLKTYQSNNIPFIFWGPRASLEPSIEIAIARSASRAELRTYYDGHSYDADFALDRLLSATFSDQSIRYVSTAPLICNPDCPTLTQGNRLFVVDRAHWTIEGANEAVRLVVQSDPVLQELFEN